MYYVYMILGWTLAWTLLGFSGLEREHPIQYITSWIALMGIWCLGYYSKRIYEWSKRK